MLHRDPEDRKYFCTCYDTPRKLRKISQVKKLKQENKRLRAVIKKLNQPEETGKQDMKDTIMKILQSCQETNWRWSTERDDEVAEVEFDDNQAAERIAQLICDKAAEIGVWSQANSVNNGLAQDTLRGWLSYQGFTDKQIKSSLEKLKS
ncbi:hypothetical protein [Chitinophaga lutea]|uniref:hypothetical protein n=1 Tax=Chitinophaga lutea TaxID=2488634 RepID=UPI000F4E67B6|nr:hypothetical protein [Chitinophaga lutea]